ncbi:MAG: EamA family transporter [Lachnospiraceae bacterium]|nr:EamA family transporter [Lachnospiraceae bacterium]
MFWMLLVLLYGLLKGAREIAKKKAMEKSTMLEVLFFYTLFSFLLTALISLLGGREGLSEIDPGNISPAMMGAMAFKAFIIFVAWICGFLAVKKMPVGVYGILDLARVLFSTLLGVVVLHEILYLPQILGLILVCAGLLMLKWIPKGKIPEKTKGSDERIPFVYILISLACCLLNSVSGLMDKMLMSTGLTAAALQFWYMLFLTLFYATFLLIRREKIDLKGVLKNLWIPVLAVMFVIADRALFIANKMPDSRMTVMTVIKQAGVFVTILGGRFVFKEKNTTYKIFCALVVVAGILISSLL